MGLTFNLGRDSAALTSDASLNVGIGGSPSGSYKLEVTGTAKVSSTLLVSGAATFSSTGTFGSDVFTYANGGIFFSGGGVYTSGIFQNASGLQLQSGGSPRLTIASTGSTTITGAGNTLTLAKSNNYPALAFQGATYTNVIESGDNYMAFNQSGSERMRINSAGFFKASNSGGYYDSTSSFFEFKSNVSDNTMIMWNSSATPSGLFINYTSSPNNTASQFLRCFDGNVATERASIRSNGGLANYSGNNVNLASDRRLKKDISLLSSEWDRLKQIEVVNFKYKDSTDETSLYGAIAQQVQTIYPELVIVTREATETEPEYFGLREQPFQWLTTKVLQEAMTKIEELQSRLDKAGL